MFGWSAGAVTCRGAEVGTPNREPQESSRDITGIYRIQEVGIVLSYSCHILEVPYLMFPTPVPLTYCPQHLGRLEVVQGPFVASSFCRDSEVVPWKSFYCLLD